MKQIDFYILKTNDPLPFTCRLLEKAYKQNHQIYVCTTSPDEAQRLNDLLWSFRDISFVPHHLTSDTDSQHSPIVIGYGEQPAVHHDIFVALTDHLPDAAKDFERVIMIVPSIEERKINARKSYKRLTDEGYNVKIHKI